MIKQLLNSVITKYHDLPVSRRSIICLSLWLRQIIYLLATDKSWYFAQPRPIIVHSCRRFASLLCPSRDPSCTRPQFLVLLARLLHLLLNRNAWGGGSSQGPLERGPRERGRERTLGANPVPYLTAHVHTHGWLDETGILVPRAYDPSGLRQESRGSGSNHFEITKEITEFCPSGLTQSSSMAHARNGCSHSLSIPAAGQKDRRLWGRECETGRSFPTAGQRERRPWVRGCLGTRLHRARNRKFDLSLL